MCTRVLVIDDDETFRQVFAEVLEAEGFDVREAADGEAARALAASFDPQVAVCDWMLRDGSRGPDVARALRARRPDLGVVLVTGYLAAELDGPAAELSARVLQKPFDVEELLASVQAVVPAPG